MQQGSGMEIVVVSDINADLVFTGLPSLPAFRELKHATGMKFTLGGSSAIFAYNIARLGVATGFVGKVGNDHVGDFLLATLGSVGVDTSRVVRDGARPTGICVSMSFPDEYAMVSYPGIRESFALHEIDLEYVKSARHLHLSSFYLQPGLQPGCVEIFRTARAAGLTTSLDPDHDPREQWNGGMQELLQYVDLFLPNETEALRISQTQDLTAAARRFSQFGHTTVIKQGREGVAVIRNGQATSAPAFEIQPLDTTGAGDSFNAGFIFKYLNRAPLQDCIVWGSACGALSTRSLGGIDAFPTCAEIEKFLVAHLHESVKMATESVL
ncbi:MAG: carbohydrate kinase [Acidobacteria bacterium]|nr:MAG: carbohydrate kinase [Acidobacteriota bacterium]